MPKRRNSKELLLFSLDMIVQDYFPDDTLNHRGAKIISKKYYMWLIDWSDGVKEIAKRGIMAWV